MYLSLHKQFQTITIGRPSSSINFLRLQTNLFGIPVALKVGCFLGFLQLFFQKRIGDFFKCDIFPPFRKCNFLLKGLKFQFQYQPRKIKLTSILWMFFFAKFSAEKLTFEKTIWQRVWTWSRVKNAIKSHLRKTTFDSIYYETLNPISLKGEPRFSHAGHISTGFAGGCVLA